MNVTGKTVSGLDGFLKEHLEADVIAVIAERRGLSTAETMGVYYASKVAEAVSEGKLGLQYLPADYLADEIIGNITTPSSEPKR